MNGLHDSNMRKNKENITGVPLSRWQRKAMQQGVTSLQVPTTSHGSGLSPGRKSAKSGDRSKTPLRGKTPSSAITPGKGGKLTPGNAFLGGRSPGRAGLSPGRDDRFIANRSAIDKDLSFYNMMSGVSINDSLNPTAQDQMQRKMAKMKEMNNGQSIEGARILHFGKDASGLDTSTKDILASANKTNKGKSQRYVPLFPEKILDAPELRDDYYQNVIDWSVNNHVAVALDNSVYIWDAYESNIFDLTMVNAGEHIPCVRWIRDGGNILAVARSGSVIELWDVYEKKLVRKLKTHSSSVGAMSWSTYTLASGETLGNIHLHDVRVADALVARVSRHRHQVCNLEWGPEQRCLASGANDNMLHVWDRHDLHKPLASLQHTAAVKAFDWCPFQRSVLATGSGSPRSVINVFNINTSSVAQSVTTDSQVTGLLWSRDYREFVTCHGYDDGKLRVWKYPQLITTHTLKGHEGRVNCMTMSPSGEMVGSAGSDESIRLWKCFEKSEEKGKSTHASKNPDKISLLRGNIR